MPSARYLARMERVLETRMQQERKARRPLLRRMPGILAALLAASICFIALKGATLAYLGPARFEGIAAPVVQGDELAGLRFWLAGPDPASQLVARAIAPDNAPRIIKAGPGTD